ncbi:MAG TPA: TIGR03013 family XrtA/PEP-CTERM system glycosyltransferase [Rhizomicrobium sp.]|nr:TIGR03013 family XrtA/PEP-CTERM system glycosyltransferase [Rhizomicrobium sp.]
MKIFGHHVAAPSVVLAGLDGALFLAALRLLSIEQHCSICYFNSLVHLDLKRASALAAVFVLLCASVGIYNADALSSFRIFLKRFAVAWQLIFMLAVGFFGVTKITEGLPFGWFMGIMALAIAIFMMVLLTVRFFFHLYYRSPFLKKRVLVLGQGVKADAATAYMTGPGKNHLKHIRTIGHGRLVENRLTWVVQGNLALGEPALAEATPLLQIAQALRVDEIVVAVDDKRGLAVWDLLECRLNGIDVIDYLNFWEREFNQIDISHVGPGTLAFTGGFHFNRRRRVFKRVADFTVSLFFLAAVLPITLLVALAIKLESRGPVFYRQERVGLNGRIFRVWKFRSMRTDAEKDGVPRWASAKDNRVTRVGRFIRATRIDEIPQIINVLEGDMSFIGPRPERPYFVQQLRREMPYYDLRHRVKPGITGWAQVNYRYGESIEDARQKLAYDLYYVKNNDFFLDLTILVQTVRVIMFAHGAQ